MADNSSLKKSRDEKNDEFYTNISDIENEISQFDTALSLWKNNDGWGYIESAIDMSSDKISNVGKYYDDVRKYSIIRNATESLKMDISFIYDEDEYSLFARNVYLYFKEYRKNEIIGVFVERQRREKTIK